jgi:uncharacterized protein with HEPN domain
LRDDVNYAVVKTLRNQIVHEYIIDESDRVVSDVLTYVPMVREILDRARQHCVKQNFI